MDLKQKIQILSLAHKMRLNTILEIQQKNYLSAMKRRKRKFKNKVFKTLMNAALLHQQILTSVSCLYVQKLLKRCRATARSRYWWDNFILSDDIGEWIQNLRVDKNTFLYLCEKVRPELQPHVNYLNKTMTVEIKVAIALYKLASCAGHNVVANKFGVPRSSVHRSVQEFCLAVVKIILPEEIRMPNKDEMAENCSEFVELCGIPQVIGALGVFHVPITPPLTNHNDFINSKDWPSIVLQALVDAKCRFIDISVKHPGSTHVGVILRDSFLYKNMESMERPVSDVNGKNVKGFVVGSSAFPLLDWLMNRYDTPESCEEDSFNFYLSKALDVADNAFKRLKSRWKIVQKQKIYASIELVPAIVSTCCVLHNIAERNGFPIEDSWLDEDDEHYHAPDIVENSEAHYKAVKIRDHLKTYMDIHYPTLESSF